ncbi:FAD-dependent oxidoreductase [Lentisphaerota bacterium WC36G]|nr:FAD-dependent oxidoreductase [Lentisphaerae bacterium WC36]
MRRKSLLRKLFASTSLAVSLFTASNLSAAEILVEAESFSNKGGWKVDPQFMDVMGSPYLLAHGLGEKVADATKLVNFPETASYNVWVRTKNWAPGNWEAPGRFNLAINNSVLSTIFGTKENKWTWQNGGKINISKGKNELKLKDLTGFAGRCDAIYFTTDDNFAPPNELKKLTAWRNKVNTETAQVTCAGKYDVIVVGGGLAGCAAAATAAEKGLKVALIHDRPVLGGNASAEIRVHTEGIYGKNKDLIKKLDTKHWPNGDAKAAIDDKKRHDFMNNIKNLTIFYNYRAYGATTENKKIKSVDAMHISSNKKLRFNGDIFIDTTGDGWVGYWAGAEYRYGRESNKEFNEAPPKGVKLHLKTKVTPKQKKQFDTKFIWSPDKADNRVMGSSLLWTTVKLEDEYKFADVPWAMEVAKDTKKSFSEWNWEFTRNDLHQIDDAEQVRDHMFKAIYGNFANLKKDPKYKNLKLKWVGYILGKRESRRLIGDYIVRLSDFQDNRYFEDTVVEESRVVDVHAQMNLLIPDYVDFLSMALFLKVGKYYLPFRSFYSKNIDNLMMAGRNISITHVALGGPRVMLTTAQMGIAVGNAAVLCKKYEVKPRGVYQKHIKELRKMIGYKEKIK